MKKDIILFKKKLGAYYLVELRHDNKEYYYIQLYKKSGEEYKKIYEPIKVDIKNGDKALCMYNYTSLKSMNTMFKERKQWNK